MKTRIFIIMLLLLFAYMATAQMTVKDNSANVLMTVNDEGTEGSITLPASSSAPGVTTNKLYNVSNILYWNGSAFADGHSLDAADGSPVDAVYVDNDGIVTLSSQSRVRAYLSVPIPVLFNTWTPLGYDLDSALPIAYDQQKEFLPAPAPGLPAIFVPLVTGYYQVNARAVFEWPEPTQLISHGYVSIAIFVNGVMYAQGNNLQMVEQGAAGAAVPLMNNNAPNVSDVVYLTPADALEIYVFQNVDGIGIMTLGVGPSQTYVSIHKSS